MPPSTGMFVFVRMFRVWAAARASGENPLPHMEEPLEMFAASPELTAACASMFDLVEAHLGRPLVPECCCAHRLSRDEQALLALLRHAPAAAQPLASPAVPHGLPGAIRWAALAIGRAMDGTFERDNAPVIEAAEPGRCPFTRSPPLYAV